MSREPVVLVVGAGGREHAIAWKLRQSPRRPRVLVAPGNGGIPNSVSVSASDAEGLVALCRDEGVDLVMVGPEAPLSEGLADRLRAEGLAVVGPGRAGTRLESSKIAAREFMARHGVASPGFEAFATAAEARAGLPEGGVVVKLDGLAAGKGVFVCGTRAEALEALATVEERYGVEAPVLLEDLLVGRELSVIGFTDGESVRLLPPSQDHKRLLAGDRGPNTGGMGAFTPVSFATDALMSQIRERIVTPTLAGLAAEAIPFRGVLYFGIMLTDDGPLLLEYNVRLGDPETEVLLPAMASDLLELLEATAHGRLAETPEVVAGPRATVDVVLVSGGYPGAYLKDQEITGLSPDGRASRDDDDLLIFHGGTRREGGRFFTAGGRVLHVTAFGEDRAAAAARAYAAVEHIDFPGKTYREDIGRGPKSVGAESGPGAVS